MTETTLHQNTVIAQAALRLAAKKEWRDIALADIEAEAGNPLSVSDKSEVLKLIFAEIDKQVLSGIQSGFDDETPRDRIFDTLMERFEALNTHRDAFKSIFKSYLHDPCQAILSFQELKNSMSWMLEVSGISSRGIDGVLKTKGLSIVYLNVLRVWIKDETPDLSKTMAELDLNLSQAERLRNMVSFIG